MATLGEQKTPESFRQACRRFVYTENLLPEAPANAEGAEAKAAPLQLPTDAVPILMRVMEQMDTEDGWVSLCAVGNQLANLASDFDLALSASVNSATSFGRPMSSSLISQKGEFFASEPSSIRGSADRRASPA
jgi:hypothetical protein